MNWRIPLLKAAQRIEFLRKGGFDAIVCFHDPDGACTWLDAALKRPREKPPRALCADCAFVHMQYGASGQNAVFCTFGGGVRQVRLNVLYCTDYRDRNAPPRLVRVGFAPEVDRAGVEA